LVVFYILFVSVGVFAQSDADKEAKWILERITGVRWPYDADILVQMSTLVSSKNSAGAVQLAMMQPQFYSITVKQLALQMSTREETISTPFNDFAAAFIGVTRDDLDARELLTGNFYYAASPTLVPAGVTIPMDIGADIVASNRHYAALESNRLNLGDVLEKRDGQLLAINNANATTANPDAAGVLTSRAYIEAHATAGTNRRLVEFAFREFMCATIDQVADTSAPDIRIGRDIDRFPGGDHTKFQTSCKGCHTVMDGFRGAFAKWNFGNGAALHSASGGTESRNAGGDANGVVGKLNQNGNVFSGGYVTRDDSWVNHANRGANALSLGWRASASTGNGVASFGAALANSQRFSQCMAKRVFNSVCRRDLSEEKQKLLFTQLGTQWESNNYRFKKLFELVAIHPQCRYKEAL
jgi:hypothetical protein